MKSQNPLRNIIIYRHQLFKPSEGFIFQQTKYLSDYHPIFAGRCISGALPESNVDTRLIQPSSAINLMRHVLWQDNEILYQALLKDKPALIHAHFGVEGVYALPLAKKLAIPLVTTFHGFDATRNRRGLLLSGKVSWINYLLYRKKLARDGNLFICVSDFIRNFLIRLGFPEDRLVTHYIGVDTDEIKPLNQKKYKKIILHVARLVEKKGTEYLLKAFATLKKKGFTAQLVIIGDGPLREKLQALSASLNIDLYIKFLGAQPPSEVIRWMQQSTLFCLPSIQAQSGDSEGLPISILEASACQIPTVATWHAGIPEAIKDGETGFLVAEKDSQALAERLAYLLENESLSEKMGLAARHFMEESFDLRLQTIKLERLYNQLLAR